jgi:hypothetical protein
MMNPRKKNQVLFAFALVLFATITVAGNCNISTSAASAKASYKGSYSCGQNGKTLCTVGAIGPGGGTIFFIDYHNQFASFNFLEVAPVGWQADRSTADPILPWCDIAGVVTQPQVNNWTNRAVGKGPKNTSQMLKVCTSGAANAIDEYDNSSRTRVKDWFLPSTGEMILLANNAQGLADLSSTEYWSSSEFSNDGAWVESVGRGYQGSAAKTASLAVRPIRSF